MYQNIKIKPEIMKKLIIILFVLNVSATFAQKEYVPDEIDYLAYNYKYLDSNFAIHIDSIEFNETVTEYKFIKERITKYQDSLGVVLMREFGDWDKMRLGKSRITYTWDRVGYHLWKNEDEIKKIAASNPKFLDYYKSHREKVVISSWHINEYESFAMWQIFTKKKTEFQSFSCVTILLLRFLLLSFNILPCISLLKYSRLILEFQIN